MKPNKGSLLRGLVDNFPRSGRLEWIGVRPGKGAPVVAVPEVEARLDRGLTGDYRARTPGSRRQVTLIQHEHFDTIGSLLGHARADPEAARRNLAVSGINVLALKDETFAIGEAIFQGTGVCAPCSKMEKWFGSGGYNAMRGHGGITARVLVAGVIRLGDAVSVLQESPAEAGLNVDEPAPTLATSIGYSPPRR